MNSPLKKANVAAGICTMCERYGERLVNGICEHCLQPFQQKLCVVPTHMNWIETVHENPIDYLDPKEESIDIKEISWGLAAVARFAGQTASDNPYCVAEHSCWVATYLFHKTKNPWIALHGLLHDAHEAYTGDIPAPMKNIPEIRQGLIDVSHRLQSCILRALQIPATVPEVEALIKEADMQALAVEVITVKGSSGKKWRDLPPIDAIAARMPAPTASDRITHHYRFMAAYKTLYGNGFNLQ